MPGAFDAGLSFDPHRIHLSGVAGRGGNSGFQALNLAVLLGARRIILLGFDMGFGADGAVHWHGPHAWTDPDTGQALSNPTQPLFDTWRRGFAAAAPQAAARGIEILNASRRTALDCFARVDLEKGLQL